MNTVYRILCEIKLLHEYYLTERDGNTIFDLATKEARQDFLQNKLLDNYPSINGDLDFEFDSQQLSVYSGLRLKLIPTYSGFQLAIAVEEKIISGNTRAFTPVFGLSDDLSISIVINKKNSNIDVISNSNLALALPASYFFSNLPFSGGKSFPFLSLPLSEKNLSLSYSQGDLVFDPAENSVKAFYVDGSGAEQWALVRGDGFVSESDRLAIASVFYYSLTGISGVSQISFKLSDSQGNEVVTQIHSISPSDKYLMIDFSGKELRVIPNGLTDGSMFYTLTVEGNNGLTRTHKLAFISPAISSDYWGLIVLQPKSSQSEYSLIDNEGLLKTRVDSNGELTSPPVFEIRIKSRFSFWRYKNNKNKKLKANSSLDPYLEFDSEKGIMESISFRNASYLPTVFRDGSNSRLLPNPSSYESLVAEKKRIYVEIPVPRSDLFDI